MATAQDELPDKSPGEVAKYWQEQLDLAEKDVRELWDDADKVIARYKGQSAGPRPSRAKKLNILYSNTEVLRAALYGKSAKPDVRKRFGMQDAAGQLVAEVLEKSLDYCADEYDSDKPIEQGLLDYLLVGRGVVRICYEPELGKHPETGDEYITDQHLYEEYVHWKDFLCMPARTWQDVCEEGWISFRHRMTREDCIENFPDVGHLVPLNWEPETTKKETPESLKKAEVYEIWDAEDRKRYWIVKGFDRPCRVDDDPYGLDDFFPLPEPPTQYATNDSVVPMPEFHVYQDQADDLDEITGRISKLTRALKRRGVYDQSIKELSRLANANDNQFIPVENYAALATRGGLQAAFQSEDISIIASVLVQLYQQRDMHVQAIWEQVGIADIMRGQSRASETLGAQQLKAQFGSQRLQRRQRAIQRWIRDILRLKAEIIAEHYEPQVLQQITGMQITPETMQILKSDDLRSYRIDVETDSTVFEDAEAEKQARGELIQAITQFMQGWGPIVQQAPPLAPVAFSLLKFGVASFKATREVEDAIEQAAAIFQQQDAQRQQDEQVNGKPPSPEDKAHQLEMAKMQADQQGKQAELQMKSQHEAQKLEIEKQKAQLDLQVKQAEIEIKKQELQLKAQEMQLKAQQAEQEHAHNLRSLELQQSVEQHKADTDHMRLEQEAYLAETGAEQEAQFRDKELALKEKALTSKASDGQT